MKLHYRQTWQHIDNNSLTSLEILISNYDSNAW